MSCGRPTIRAPRPQKSIRGEFDMSVEKPSLTIKQPKKTIDWRSVRGIEHGVKWERTSEKINTRN